MIILLDFLSVIISSLAFAVIFGIFLFFAVKDYINPFYSEKKYQKRKNRIHSENRPKFSPAFFRTFEMKIFTSTAVRI